MLTAQVKVNAFGKIKICRKSIDAAQTNVHASFSLNNFQLETNVADTFRISNMDGTIEDAEVIEHFKAQTPVGLVTFVTHLADAADGTCRMKKISHFRSGLAITLVPEVVPVDGCIRALESAFSAHSAARVKQRLTEPETLNTEVPTATSIHQKEETMSLEQAILDNTKAVADLTAALLQHIANNPGKAAAPAADATAKAADKPKTKTVKEEVKAPAPKAEEPAAAVLTLEDVKPVAVKLAADKGRDVLVALLQRLGVAGDAPKTSGLKADQYGEFIELAGKIHAGEYDPIASDSDDI